MFCPLNLILLCHTCVLSVKLDFIMSYLYFCPLKLIFLCHTCISIHWNWFYYVILVFLSIELDFIMSYLCFCPLNLVLLCHTCVSVHWTWFYYVILVFLSIKIDFIMSNSADTEWYLHVIVQSQIKQKFSFYYETSNTPHVQLKPQIYELVDIVLQLHDDMSNQRLVHQPSVILPSSMPSLIDPVHNI